MSGEDVEHSALPLTS